MAVHRNVGSHMVTCVGLTSLFVHTNAYAMGSIYAITDHRFSAYRTVLKQLPSDNCRHL